MPLVGDYRVLCGDDRLDRRAEDRSLEVESSMYVVRCLNDSRPSSEFSNLIVMPERPPGLDMRDDLWDAELSNPSLNFTSFLALN